MRRFVNAIIRFIRKCNEKRRKAVATPDNTQHDKTRSSTDKTPLAQLYFFSVLDYLVDLAHTVSHDFTSRPQLYSGLGPSDTNLFGKFYTQYGTEPEFLEPSQRNDIFYALFGTPGDDEGNDCDSFQLLRDSLLKACARYTANIRLGDNKAPLDAEVETALIPFRQYLLGLQGGSVQWSHDRLTEVTTAAYSILQNPTVATVFGVPRAPEEPWPLKPDPNGNILVEEISKKRFTRGLFGLLRQVALRGAETIDNVIEGNGQVNDEMINGCNAWHAALMEAKNASCAAGLHDIGGI